MSYIVIIKETQDENDSYGKSIYEQTVEELDVDAVIKAVNGFDKESK